MKIITIPRQPHAGYQQLSLSASGQQSLHEHHLIRNSMHFVLRRARTSQTTGPDYPFLTSLLTAVWLQQQEKEIICWPWVQRLTYADSVEFLWVGGKGLLGEIADHIYLRLQILDLEAIGLTCFVVVWYSVAPEEDKSEECEKKCGRTQISAIS